MAGPCFAERQPAPAADMPRETTSLPSRRTLDNQHHGHFPVLPCRCSASNHHRPRPSSDCLYVLSYVMCCRLPQLSGHKPFTCSRVSLAAWSHVAAGLDRPPHIHSIRNSHMSTTRPSRLSHLHGIASFDSNQQATMPCFTSPTSTTHHALFTPQRPPPLLRAR